MGQSCFGAKYCINLYVPMHLITLIASLSSVLDFFGLFHYRFGHNETSSHDVQWDHREVTAAISI